jgi:cell division septation protein DedD
MSSNASETSTFSRLIGWTLALSLVFSAGMITGQRILRQESLPPLVQLSSARAVADTPDAEGASVGPKLTSYSFYDHLLKDGEAKPGAKATKAEKKKKKEEPSRVVARKEKKENAEPKKQPAAAKPQAEPKKPEVKQVAAAPPKKAERVAPIPGIGAVARAVLPKKVASEQPPRALPARYTLQVGSHPQKSRAVTQMDKLSRMGMEPALIVADVPGKGTLYRVRVGKFHSMDEARTYQASMRSKSGLESFVTPL